MSVTVKREQGDGRELVVKQEGSLVVKREQCATCRYFKEAVDVSGKLLDVVGGWCMRYPPLVKMMGGEDRTLFPVIYVGTEKKVWCGEWEDAS